MRGLKLSVLALGICLAAALIVVSVDPTFWRRRLTLPMKHIVTATDWYSPRVVVAGAAGPALVGAAPSERVIAATALDAALDYGKAHPTVALLVFHAGRIELEYYGRGYSANSLTDSQSMHKSVLALLYGNPDRSFFSNELVALAQSGTGAVQRELASLADVGLLTVRLGL